jgi:hypothetical protein
MERLRLLKRVLGSLCDSSAAWWHYQTDGGLLSYIRGHLKLKDKTWKIRGHSITVSSLPLCVYMGVVLVDWKDPVDVGLGFPE